MAKRSKVGISGKKNNLRDSQVEKVVPPAGILWRPFVHLLIVVLFGLFSYSNIFHSPFQWDDYGYWLKDNPIIKDLHYFLEPSLARTFVQYAALKSRYIGYLTFALNYKLHGFDVTGYHIVNFSIHIINALLVYFLVLLTFRTPYFTREKLEVRSQKPEKGQEAIGKQQSSGLTIYYSRFIAFAAALLFVSHPVQTEAVTYIFQRLASLVTLFYLLSIVLYIKGRLLSREKSEVKAKAETKQVHSTLTFIYFFLSFLCAVLAMKTKENAFTLPLVITLYEFLFFFGPIKKRLLRLLPLLLTLLIIPLTLSGVDKTPIEMAENPGYLDFRSSTITRGDYLLTQFRVIITYIRLLFLPISQNVDYDYPIYYSFFTPAVIVSFLFLLFVFGVAIYLPYKTRGEESKKDSILKAHDSSFAFRGLYRLIGFGIIWFFVTLSVESSIIPIPMVIDEYRVYLPSVGALTAIMTGAVMLVHRVRTSIPVIGRIGIVSIVLIATALSVLTYKRNEVWGQEFTLWADVTKKSPDKARPHYNLGVFYSSSGRFDEALEEYKTAVRLNPKYTEARNNLGNSYFRQGHMIEALREFEAASKLKNDSATIHFNIGNVYVRLGRQAEAIREYQTAVRLNPDFAQVHSSLGDVYDKQGHPNEAIMEYQVVLRTSPNDAEAHYKLGNAYFDLRRYDDALKEYQITLQLRPNYAEAHNNLGTVYYMKGRKDEALREYRRALQIKPDYTDARKNLEILSKRLGII